MKLFLAASRCSSFSVQSTLSLLPKSRANKLINQLISQVNLYLGPSRGNNVFCMVFSVFFVSILCIRTNEHKPPNESQGNCPTRILVILARHSNHTMLTRILSLHGHKSQLPCANKTSPRQRKLLEGIN